MKNNVITLLACIALAAPFQTPAHDSTPSRARSHSTSSTDAVARGASGQDLYDTSFHFDSRAHATPKSSATKSSSAKAKYKILAAQTEIAKSAYEEAAQKLHDYQDKVRDGAPEDPEEEKRLRDDYYAKRDFFLDLKSKTKAARIKAHSAARKAREAHTEPRFSSRDVVIHGSSADDLYEASLRFDPAKN